MLHYIHPELTIEMLLLIILNIFKKPFFKALKSIFKAG